MQGLVLLWACLVLPVSGNGAMKGPKEISGFEGDTLAVRCTYSQEWIKHGKYWCKQGGLLISRCSNTIYTRGDQEVTQDRLSIRDSPQELAFTVTVKHLTLEDTGKYWCGVNILGPDKIFEVTLIVFPGNRGSASTTGHCCPPPTPSFQPLIAVRSLQRPQPKSKGWRTQPQELMSSDLRPTITTVKQGKTGIEATPSTGVAPKWPATPSPYPGTSPQAETSPHTTTSPHAGSSHPAILVDSTTAEDTNPVPSGSRSKHSVTIPMVRKLAPVLVILSLLLATGLIAFGSHIFQWRKKAQLAMETQKNEQKDEKVYLPGSTTEEEEAPSEDPKGNMILAPALQMSQEEPDFSEFIPV
ncbi:CMRF35-like molecule 9 isoform X1 [Dipodomys spectabilis]|uniref:CMRF35-like molecule 9 isoform X1 n=1 Tax=Dipodomys spectabilis TaxID=105255 RepID=UPI001C5458C6|nr:CMRF35-like molecule 9 isoform X1 [Dipodomys spectabilis]